MQEDQHQQYQQWCCSRRQYLEQHVNASNVNDIVLGNFTTDLNMAVCRKCVHCVRWLVESVGADVNYVSSVGVHTAYAPIHLACKLGSTREVVKYLLRHKANPNICIPSNVVDHDTPLSSATSNHYIGYVRLLLDHGTVIDQTRTPIWVKNLAIGRTRCYNTVIALLGVRRFGRSKLANKNAKDIFVIIANKVWGSRWKPDWAK